MDRLDCLEGLSGGQLRAMKIRAAKGEAKKGGAMQDSGRHVKLAQGKKG